MRNACLLLISHLVYGILLQQPKLTMMITFHKVDMNFGNGNGNIGIIEPFA